MTETRSGEADNPRTAPSPIADVTEALGGFLSEVNRFHDEMKTKFQK